MATAETYYTSVFSGEEIDDLLAGRGIAPIRGRYATLAALNAAHPEGNEYAYLVAADNNVYVYNPDSAAAVKWEPIGEIAGPIVAVEAAAKAAVEAAEAAGAAKQSAENSEQIAVGAATSACQNAGAAQAARENASASEQRAAAYATSATASAQLAATGKTSYIGENGNWYTWSLDTGRYVDTGVQARGPEGQQGIIGPPGTAGKSAYQSYLDTGGTLTEAQWVASLAQGAPEYAATVEDMTDTDKIYLGSNGHLWVYGEGTIIPDPTYINRYNASEAADDVRLNSSGGTTALAGSMATGYIQCSPNSVVRVKGLPLITTEGVQGKTTFYDPNKTFISNITDLGGGIVEDEGNGVYAIYCSRVALPGGIKGVGFVRVSGHGNSGDDIIITVDEEIEDPEPVVGNTWVDTGLSYAPADYEERIVVLENDSADHEARLDALEQGEDKSVPVYWQTAIDGLKDKMKDRQANGASCFQFVWFSDMHGTVGYPNSNGAGTSSQLNIGPVCQKVCEQYNIPLVAISGDIMSQSSYPAVSSVYAEYEAINKVLAAIDKDRLLATIGNHDGAWGDAVDGVYYLKDIGNRALYNEVFRRQATDLSRVFGPDGTYFYVDSHPQKIRMVMLNCHTDGDGSNDANGYAVYNSMKNFVLGTQQLLWLENIALDVPEGWGIVLMAHGPVSLIKDGMLLKNIIAAYNGKTSYAGASVDLADAYWGNGLTSEYNTSTSVSKDFAGAKGEIIAYFHGHIHKDQIDVTSLSVPSISITTAGGDVRDTDPPTRTPGTATETAMDIVTIDRRAKTIYMTRLGVGDDRSVAYD